MQRSIYPDSVEVDQNALAYTESTKIEQILDRTLAVAQTGVFSGLTITVNGLNNQLFDVAPGEVYVPSAELAILAAAVIGTALADNTAGVVNYVLATYTETETTPEPNENGTDIDETLVTSAAVISCLTQAQYNALLPTVQIEMAIIGSITATGAAIGPIVQSSPYINILAPSQPVAITGVSIVGIDFTTPAGNGTLDFNAPPTNVLIDPTIAAPRLRWAAPGDGGVFGHYVNVSVDGVYVLTGVSGHTLTVSVITITLPLINTTETIVVSSLYNPLIARFSAEDALHRSMIGSGIPSPTNPHGTTFKDLGGSANAQVVEHQFLMHSDGILRTSNPSFLATTVVPVGGPTPDYIAITTPLAGDAYFVAGNELLTLGSNQILFTAPVVSNIALYDLLLDADGNPSRVLRAEHSATPIGGVAIIDMDDAIGAGTFNLVYNLATSTLTWNGGAPTIVRGRNNYILHDPAGHKVTVNVGDSVFGVLPVVGGPVFTDVITVSAVTDRTLNFQVASVTWDGDHNLGWTISALNPRVTTDKRFFGTLGLPQIRDDVTADLTNNETASFTVGDGVNTFGDINGSSAIQTVCNLLAASGRGGTIAVKSGAYDPFQVNQSDIQIICSGGVVIDGVNATLTPGACITVNADRFRMSNLTVQNAGYGISQLSGNDCQGSGIVFGSGLTANLTWIAGNQNSYKGPVRQVRTLANAGTLSPFDDIVLLNAASAPFTVMLPLSTACRDTLTLKKIDPSINLVTIAAGGLDTVDFTSEIGTDVYLESFRLDPAPANGWIS